MRFHRWDKEPDVLNAADVARILDVSAKTVRAMLAAGEIPARKVGQKWLVAKSRLIDYVECR